MDRPTLDTFARRPREALMWIPRAIDIARIRAALAASATTRGAPGAGDAPPRAARFVDVGAGTGLLAALLGPDVEPVDPTPPPTRYVRIGTAPSATTYDAAIVSWMEAGHDYRASVAKLAPVLINAYDVEGGCGVMGQVDFAPFGFVEAASWRTPSFEDAAYAIDHRGALQRKGAPGNRIDVLTRDPAMVPALRAAVDAARAGDPPPWEAEMDRFRL